VRGRALDALACRRNERLQHSRGSQSLPVAVCRRMRGGSLGAVMSMAVEFHVQNEE
jgi:hypothetical protein